MNRRKTYEWANEWICKQGGCDDRFYSDKVDDLELPSPIEDEAGRVRELALIVDVRENGELVDQQWAYVRGNDLPSHFEDGLPVPGRFQAELHTYINERSKA